MNGGAVELACVKLRQRLEKMIDDITGTVPDWVNAYRANGNKYNKEKKIREALYNSSLVLGGSSEHKAPTYQW